MCTRPNAVYINGIHYSCADPVHTRPRLFDHCAPRKGFFLLFSKNHLEQPHDRTRLRNRRRIKSSTLAHPCSWPPRDLCTPLKVTFAPRTSYYKTRPLHNTGSSTAAAAVLCRPCYAVVVLESIFFSHVRFKRSIRFDYRDINHCKEGKTTTASGFTGHPDAFSDPANRPADVGPPGQFR